MNHVQAWLTSLLAIGAGNLLLGLFGLGKLTQAVADLRDWVTRIDGRCDTCILRRQINK